MSARKSIPDTEKASQNYQKTLDLLQALDSLRRAGRQGGREYQRAFADFINLRGRLSADERVTADLRSQKLWRDYTRFLEEDGKTQAERPSLPARRDRRQDTTAPRRQPEPSTTLPGSESRLRELSRRRRLGMDLRAPGDVDDDPARGLKSLQQRNGAGKQRATGAETVAQRGANQITTSSCPIGLAGRLVQARRNRGWGQKVLARKSGVTQQHISMIERGERRPSIEAVKALATALNIASDVLLGMTTVTVR